jgi:broad specificity phosphatase PhoE
MGRPRSQVAADFPDLAFDHLPEIWWHDDGVKDANGIAREPYETFLTRVEAFRLWLRRRPEDRICVVGHGTFFQHLCGHFMANCEMRPWDPKAAAPAVTRRG